jgi:hypothetical protein
MDGIGVSLQKKILEQKNYKTRSSHKGRKACAPERIRGVQLGVTPKSEQTRQGLCSAM